MECDIVRVLDGDSTLNGPQGQVYLMVNRYPLKSMPYVAPEKNKEFFYTDEQRQVTWCTGYGMVHDQENVII